MHCFAFGITNQISETDLIAQVDKLDSLLPCQVEVGIRGLRFCSVVKKLLPDTILLKKFTHFWARLTNLTYVPPSKIHLIENAKNNTFHCIHTFLFVLYYLLSVCPSIYGFALSISGPEVDTFGIF